MTAAARFLILGGLTTGATYAIYLLALSHVSPMVAYLIALAGAMLIQGALMAPFVFRTRLDSSRLVRSVLLYLAYTAVYTAMMKVVLWAGVPPVAAPAIVIAVVAPIQFLVGRRWVGN